MTTIYQTGESRRPAGRQGERSGEEHSTGSDAGADSNEISEAPREGTHEVPAEEHRAAGASGQQGRPRTANANPQIRSYTQQTKMAQMCAPKIQRRNCRWRVPGGGPKESGRKTKRLS